ncbi:hypothetical protein AGMMS50268_10830 [Spirochaetia bacterium]|nr:hypothetical protein AGMMS50268_10830 [Spirochaetia bacterium]
MRTTAFGRPRPEKDKAAAVRAQDLFPQCLAVRTNGKPPFIHRSRRPQQRIDMDLIHYPGNTFRAKIYIPGLTNGAYKVHII